MRSKIKSRNAINFLALVRKDLKSAELDEESESTVVTSRLSEFNTETIPNGDSIPAILGRFEIIEQIGEGGFAKVFLANDPSLDREVAIKVPKPEGLLSAESRARFEREAKSAAILSHPNIVPVFEIGSVGPIHFIASEFCAGPTLHQWLANRKQVLSPREAAKIVCCLADAVQHAHQRGIIHRDLKPTNIILVNDDHDIASRLRITDFGLARQVYEEESLTANGAIVGTPGYMSPEQAQGIRNIDRRTDVYSLGMILYQLLTGNTPFKRLNHAASIAAVINEAVPPPGNINTKVDRDLEAICLKSLEKDPSSRYESAHDFRRDLTHWMDGHAVSARKSSQAETFVRWLKRNPLVASAVAFGVTCLAIGLLFSASQWNRAESNLQQSEQQRLRAEKNAGQLHATVIRALEISLDALEKDPCILPSQQKILDELMLTHKRLIDEEAEQATITTETFDCYERLTRIYRNTARYDEASAICDQAEKLVDHCFRTDEGKKQFGLQAAEVYIQRGLIAQDTNKKTIQASAYARGIELLEQSEKNSDRELWLEKGFRFYRNLGFAHLSNADDAACISAFAKAAECADEALELDPDSALTNFNAALCYCDMGHVGRRGKDWVLSLELLEEAERRFMEIDANPKLNVDCRYRLCYIRSRICRHLRNLKDYERAEVYIRQSLDGLRQLIEENPGVYRYTNRLSQAYMRLINVYHDKEMFDEVLALLPEANLAHLKATPSWTDHRIGVSQILEGRIFADQRNEPERAEASFDAAIAVMEASQFFELSNDQLVDTILEAHRRKSILYDGLKQPADAIESAGEGYRLAVERALSIPNDHNIGRALHRGTYYAKRLGETGKFGHAKSVLDTLSEAGITSQKAQYDVAKSWAKLDSLQRNSGQDKEHWQFSRENAIKHLANAVSLGFDDYDRLQKEYRFREYRHVPQFKAICDQIRPE